MKKPEIWKLVLGCLMPTKCDFSRDDWRTYIHRYLLPEIQSETLRFYGENTSAEALHPGLDYADPGHRTRLQAFPRHNQLFGVFDNLRLTPSEIHSLCKWEGTRLSKENFERQHNTKIKETTWDDVQSYNKQTPNGYLIPDRHFLRGGLIQANPVYQLASSSGAEMDKEMMEGSEDAGEDEDSGEESEDELQRSYGVELNQRFLDGRTDADWEQWMKEAAERGDAQGWAPLSALSGLHASAASERRNSQRTAQMRLALSPTGALADQESSISQRNPQQAQMDPTTLVLNSHGTIAQYVRPLSPWISHPYNALHPASQSSEPLSSAAQPQAPQTAPLASNVNVGPNTPGQVLQAPNSTTASHSTYWGREIPEIFSDRPRPHVAALQAQLPPPPRYTEFFPAARVISASAAGPAQTPPSATTSTDVPT